MSHRRANSFSQSEIDMACQVLLTMLSGGSTGPVLPQQAAFQSLVTRFQKMRTSFNEVP